MRRFGIIQLNESKEQDDLIIDYQSEVAMNGTSLDYDKDLIQTLTQLKPLKVIIPYADKISNVFKNMKANIIVRTNYNRFIDFIKYSAILHQQQRTYEGDNTIQASSEDYDKAVDWYDYMFRNQHLIPITTDQQRLIEIVKTLGEASFKDILSEATFAGRTWIFTNLNLLVEKGFLNKERIKDESGYSDKKIDTYSVVNKKKLELPYYWDLT
ncbi:MAG: hypothetical protein PHT91_00420 [Candidatus Nanoarchaeia archaeon]|nr:hypothetical protein [Candidatus Nanoarchaeia archaeon]